MSGVGEVDVEGGQTRAVRLQVNPARLAGLGLSLEDVRAAIAATTTDNPEGISSTGRGRPSRSAPTTSCSPPRPIGDAVIAYRNGAPVLLRDIGRAIDGVENSELAAWFNGTPAVILDIQRQPGANTIEVVEAVKALLPKLQASLPPALKISVVTDRTTTIRAAIADVQFTLVLTVALVVLVIFLFLRKLWATVIPSVTLPVSLIATFGGMALCGFSLDNLSLMALTIASGFVVDDAIVMIENIVRYVEAGEAPLPAALKGARQIGFTIISLTVSLIAVFIPLLLMGGVVGRLFREFAITLSLAVIISGVVSLTLTPMMCAHAAAARIRRTSSAAALFRWSERGFDGLLRRLCARPRLGAAASRPDAGLHGADAWSRPVWLYVTIHKGFLPQQDTGLLVGTTDAAQDISFAAMSERQQQVADIDGARSGRGRGGQLRRRRHRQHHAEQRAALHRHRRAGPAQGLGGDGDGAAAGGDCRRARHHAAPAAGAGSADRDPYRRARSTNTSCRTSTKPSCEPGARGWSTRCAGSRSWPT